GERAASSCGRPTATQARSIFQPDRRSARSTDSAIDRTVWSMLTTTPFFKPDDGTVPWPMIVIRPSRLTSPIRVHTFDVPTSIPTRTASLSTFVVRASGWLHEMAPDQRHVVEDPEPEVDQRHEIQVEAGRRGAERGAAREDRGR